MDFFKSVFSENAEPSSPGETPDSSPKSQPEDQEFIDQASSDSPYSSSSLSPNPNPSIGAITSAWSFGGLIKTLASKSESVIETYRRDLEEFGSGLRKETAVIREVASRAVRDLPTSLEAGAAVAQESLESVGQAIDNIGSTVSEIIAQGKDSILSVDSDGETSSYKEISGSQQNLNLSSKPYSRLDAQIRSTQCDMNTYCKEPENLEEYNEWKMGFKLDEKGVEIEDLIAENGLIEEIYKEVVPAVVDHETFWTRYFYRVYKIKKAEEARAYLVKRAIAGEEEEELSWDVDDDNDYEENNGSKSMCDAQGKVEDKDSSENDIQMSSVERAEKSSEVKSDEKGVLPKSRTDCAVDERGHSDESGSSGSKPVAKSEDNLSSQEKTENSASYKESDISVLSSQPLIPQEEEIGWDEIEDIGSNDEVKGTTKDTASGSPNRAELRKKLSAMEDDEDLSWDIEDE
ncbi:hypothetical protein NMG60_11025198 [Bertholletia excelsa]